MDLKVIMNCSNDYAGNKEESKNFKFCRINRIHEHDIPFRLSQIEIIF